MVVKSRKKSGRGHAISKVKRNNQIRTKLVKQGKFKVQRNKRANNITRNPKKKNAPRVEPEQEDEGESDAEDMRGMVEQDDLKFLKEAVSAQSYSMLKRMRYTQPKNEGPPRKRRAKEGGEGEEGVDKMEEEFAEQREAELANARPIRELLPIKTSEGLVRRTTTEAVQKLKPQKPQAPEEAEAQEEEEEENEGELELVEETEDYRLDLSKPISTAQMLAVRQEQLNKFRISIGSLASGLLEDPENKLGNLRHLLNMMSKPQPTEVRLTVPRLAAVSLLEVFKDLLPEYQIKNVEEPGVRLKKDTLQLRTSENVLLSAYKQYLSLLEKQINSMRQKGKRPSPQVERLAINALYCLGEMLVARPYFNFSPNLARLLVPFLDHRSPEARECVSKALSSTLKEDKKGQISFEIVRRINALVKYRLHLVRPECILVLLALRIKDINLDREKEIELKQKKVMSRKEKLLATSKRERKRNKRLEEINKELLETNAEENRQNKQQAFTDVTKLVFTILFRVLKAAPKSALLCATLEGLAKFAHCINVEFYQDLVFVLDNLLSDEDEPLPPKHQLLCVKTVFTILSGQGEFLTIDPSSFYCHLYRNLLPLCAGQYQSELEVALSTLSSLILKRRKSVSQQRLLAFTKRLCTLALQQSQHGALGCLQLVKTILQLSRGVDILLEPDSSVGQGVYMPEVEEPEYCNASNTALYELATLQRHFHPTVKQYAHHLVLGAQATGDGSLPAELDKLSAVELLKEYDPTLVAFKPSIASPWHFRAKQRLHFTPGNMQDSELREVAEKVLAEPVSSEDFYTELVGADKCEGETDKLPEKSDKKVSKKETLKKTDKKLTKKVTKVGSPAKLTKKSPSKISKKTPVKKSSSIKTDKKLSKKKSPTKLTKKSSKIL